MDKWTSQNTRDSYDLQIMFKFYNNKATTPLSHQAEK